MRNLRRNQEPVFYKQYLGRTEIIDEFGNPSGLFVPNYSEMRSAMLCVSPNKGATEVEQFGSFENYDKTMTTADKNCPIDENSVLWLDGADTSQGYNYAVTKVARWKNSTQYAVRAVKVAQYEQERSVMSDA